MSRYIDADAIEKDDGLVTVIFGERYYHETILKNAPTADVAEVVRCRECLYHNKGENEVESWNWCGYRPWQYMSTEDDNYCGHGKKKDEVKNDYQLNHSGLL